MGNGSPGWCNHNRPGAECLTMAALILVFAGLLVFAVTCELLSLGYQPATLVALFSSLSAPQKTVWLIICLVPLSLLAIALLQQFKMIGQGKIADALKARLRGIRKDVCGLEETQKDIDLASQYLDHNDPETAISALQARVDRAKQAIQSHQQHDQSLIGRVETICQQQQEIRDKFGQLTAQRRSLLSQLRSSQDDIERTVAAIERDEKGDNLEDRLQKLSEFIKATSSRCDEIEDAMPSMLQLGQKLSAIEKRIAPLDEKQTGVSSVLKAVSDAGNRLAATIAHLEQDEGVSLTERIRQLTTTKRELDERVSTVLTQFSAVQVIYRDINVLFARLNKAQLSGKHFEGVTPINLLAASQ